MNEIIRPGLRERKRAKTFIDIHQAAAELALQIGLEHATVQAISDRANVSSRTFFNYFSSKEDAVLGIGSTDLDAESILELELVRTDDLLHDVASLVYAVMVGSRDLHEGIELRRDVIEAYPQLILRQLSRVADLEDQLSAVVVEWLSAEPRFADDSEEERSYSARLLLSACLTAMRFAMKTWKAERKTDPATDPKQNYTRAIDLLRTAMSKVS